MRVMQWLEPWCGVDDVETRAALQEELRREIGSSHALIGLPATTLAAPRSR
jgi:hypothetical protein